MDGPGGGAVAIGFTSDSPLNLISGFGLQDWTIGCPASTSAGSYGPPKAGVAPAVLSATSANDGGAGQAGAAAFVGGDLTANRDDVKMGVDTSMQFGNHGSAWIQATSEGRTHMPLLLNPAGGPVMVGSGGLIASPGTSPVSCSGPPSAAFAVKNGVVSHC